MYGTFLGDFQDGDADEKRNLKGFFIQEEDTDIDADPLTSEGIYVYDPNTFIDVNVGDLVRAFVLIGNSIDLKLFPINNFLSKQLLGQSSWNH